MLGHLLIKFEASAGQYIYFNENYRKLKKMRWHLLIVNLQNEYYMQLFEMTPVSEFTDLCPTSRFSYKKSCLQVKLTFFNSC